MSWLRGRPKSTPVEKEALSQKQLQVADRLAEMKGVTRDEVLAEAYRRADRILKAK